MGIVGSRPCVKECAVNPQLAQCLYQGSRSQVSYLDHSIALWMAFVHHPKSPLIVEGRCNQTGLSTNGHSSSK